MSAILNHAREYSRLGLSPIRVRTDGTKAPVGDNWTKFCAQRADDELLATWFGNGHVYGIGIARGPASGNLAVLDFETAPAFDSWVAAIPSDTSRRLQRLSDRSHALGRVACLVPIDDFDSRNSAGPA